jgi:hypothetical protein
MLQPSALAAAPQQQLTAAHAFPEELVIRVDDRWNHYWHVVPPPGGDEPVWGFVIAFAMRLSPIEELEAPVRDRNRRVMARR